jgi:hypothetical protein
MKSAGRIAVEALGVLVALAVSAATADVLLAAYLVFDAWRGGALGQDAGFGEGTVLIFGAFFVALGHAVVLGLPAFVLLRWAGWTRWWVCLPAGFAIGALPFAVMFSPFTEAAGFSQVGDKILVQGGVTTLAGWIAYLTGVAGLGILGMAGALAAWLTWRFFTRLAARGA